MKQYLQSSVFACMLVFICSNSLSAQVKMDANSWVSPGGTWSITTTKINELILIGTGGCCAPLSMSPGTVTVNGVNATYIVGIDCDNYFPCYIWAYVAPTIGTYNIVCNENGLSGSQWIFNFAASCYQTGYVLSLANITPTTSNQNVPYDSISCWITTTHAGAWVYGLNIFNDNYATGTISWNNTLTMLVAHYQAPGYPGVWGSHADSTFAVAGTHKVHVTDIGVTNPYTSLAVVAVEPSLVLPVQLLNFNCTSMDNGIKLYWSTATESNSSHYTIERSSDGMKFGPYADVPAAGNAETQQNYTYVDESPMLGTNYYRLTETDLDGSVHTYFVTFCDNNKAPVNQIYPNPSQGNFTLALGASAFGQTLIITDMLGRQVFTQQFPANENPDTYSINLPVGLKGIYTATILTNSQALAVKKLIIY